MHTSCVLSLLELQQRLREFYRAEYAGIQYVPTRPDKECSFRDIYVLPKLVKIDHRQIENEGEHVKRETVTTYREVFSDYGGSCRNVFVVGEAGSGKSSFSQNISLIWSEEAREDETQVHSRDSHFTDVDIVRQFEFVFHVTLRDSRHSCNYVEMIRDQLLHRLYKSQDIETACALVEEVLETSACLIVADGLDEWVHPIGPCKCTSKERGITPLIHQRNRATVVLTSRPVGFTKVPENKIDNYLEIEGAEDIKQLGKNILKVLNGNTGTKRFDEFEATVMENSIVGDILQSPILLIQMICLWYDNHELSKSITITYASIIDMLLGRVNDVYVSSHIKKLDKTLPCVISKMKNISKYWKNFSDLCDLAYQKLFQKDGHSSVVFNTDDCTDDLKLFAVKCGLLSEKKSTSVSHHSCHLSFQHKTFQEYLGAVHLSLHGDLLTSDIEPRYNNYYDAHTALEKVFIFLCAFNAITAGKMSVFLNKLDKDDPNLLISKGFREALYAANSDIYLACPRKIQIDTPLASDMHVYKKWIKQNQKQIVNLIVKGCEQEIVSDFEIISKMQSLQHVVLNGMDLSKNELHLPNNVKDITLDHVSMMRGDFLHNLSQLQQIILLNMDLGDTQLILPRSVMNVLLNTVTTTRGDFLHDLPNLQNVRLVNMKLDDLQLNLPSSITYINLESVTATRADLRNLSQLQYVRIRNMHLGNLKLHLPSSVTNIHFQNVTLTKGDSLRHLPHLKEVTLQSMKLCDLQLQLSSSVTKITLHRVSTTRRDFLHNVNQLQDIRLVNMDLVDFPIPSSARKLYLKGVTIPAEAMLRLVEELERSSHDIECDVWWCIVEPANQIELIVKRIRESTCLKLSFYGDENATLTFSVQKC